MPGINADFICHRLAIHKEARPVAQRKRKVVSSTPTDRANYCYRVMPFGLKNAGAMMELATYQRLMDKVFHRQIRRNMEVYVDDMVVKTTSTEAHVADLAEVFGHIRRHNMRLNPEKCVFGVQGGKFLGFMITSRGIEANPEKCKAIIQMQRPIFTLLRKPKNFEWTDQCEEAFKSFKAFLTTPPILQRPNHKTDLFLYLAVAENAISAVIVQEHQKVQTPIYFISRVLQDAVPNDREASTGTRHRGSASLTLLPKSPSSRQDRLPNQADLEEAGARWANDCMVGRVIQVRHPVRKSWRPESPMPSRLRSRTHAHLCRGTTGMDFTR
uniref:Retrovirus-related Pol polyprotein from transposon 412 family n=1 Tax=Cajanus cajan TaxID=3821 RepID=A0A151RZN6_CAJCA|nr:Retrovirus-related Pol polyprotein from transposon 412 family [Cajanus cajan]